MLTEMVYQMLELLSYLRANGCARRWIVVDLQRDWNTVFPPSAAPRE
jgi:hypothetical protein